jgi:tetratricopeptide (TPR) repeat protein
LGEWHALRGEWEKARNRFEDVLQFQQPEDTRSSGDYYHEALALLKLRDETSFASLREAALKRFKNTTNETTAQYAAEIGLLLPAGDSTMANLEPLVQLLARAAVPGSITNSGMACWDLMCLGLFEYRRGNYGKVVELCRRSLESVNVAIPTVQDEAILAMSLHKLGDDATARAELDKAKRLAQRGLNRGVDSWRWRDWVFAHLLLQEADSLIAQSSLTEPSAAPEW